jgi:hypothetical protein
MHLHILTPRSESYDVSNRYWAIIMPQAHSIWTRAYMVTGPVYPEPGNELCPQRSSAWAPQLWSKTVSRCGARVHDRFARGAHWQGAIQAAERRECMSKPNPAASPLLGKHGECAVSDRLAVGTDRLATGQLKRAVACRQASRITYGVLVIS